MFTLFLLVLVDGLEIKKNYINNFLKKNYKWSNYESSKFIMDYGNKVVILITSHFKIIKPYIRGRIVFYK